MPITFDGPNKRINITSPTTITTVSSIYKQAMEWADGDINMKYLCPMEATGYESIGGGVHTDKIFILLYGWKIKPWSGDYQLRITGSLITDDETARAVLPDSGNVQMIFEIATYGTVVAVGSGVTEQDKLDIADKVWEHTKGTNLDTRIDLIRKVEEGRWKIENNQMTIYDDDNVTPLLTFNLSGEQKRAYAERTPV